MLTFQEEQVRDCWEEVYPLAADHHKSSENYKRHEPFNPLRERYERYNDAGMFHLLTARDHGQLVGYFGVYIMESMHSQLPIAREDTFYLAPSHRKGTNAIRFLRFVEGYISRWAPVEVLFSHEIDNASGINRILDYLDYIPVITVRSKFISTRADSAEPTVMEAAHVGST